MATKERERDVMEINAAQLRKEETQARAVVFQCYHIDRDLAQCWELSRREE